MASNAPTLAVGAPKGDASQQRTLPSVDSGAPLAGDPAEPGKNVAALQASNGTTLDNKGGAKRAFSPAAGGDAGDKRRKVVEQAGAGGGGSVGGAAPGQTASAGAVAGDSAGEPAAGAATTEAAGAATEGAALTALWTKPAPTAPGAPVAVAPVAFNATLLGRTPHRHQSSLCLPLMDSIQTVPVIEREGWFGVALNVAWVPAGAGAGLATAAPETQLMLGRMKKGSALPEFVLGGATVEAAGVLREGARYAHHTLSPRPFPISEFWHPNP